MSKERVETPPTEPSYVEKFDAFMERALLKDPKGLYSLPRQYPDLQFAFGEMENTYYYIKIGIKDDKQSAMKRELSYYSTPVARHNFIFTIEDDGSLTRLIEILPRDQETRQAKFIASNLGTEMGKKFVKHLTKKQSMLPKNVDALFALDDEDLHELMAAHDKLLDLD